MKQISTCHETLKSFFEQQMPWKDRRHLMTFSWIIVGLLESKKTHLPEWAPIVKSRAKKAQSTERRFRRWLSNERIEQKILYQAFIQSILKNWGKKPFYLALDTTLLWEKYCVVRLSLVYRGRAIPISWKVMEHASSSVSFSDYRSVLEEANQILPSGIHTTILADRGFVHVELMQFLKTLHWHWHIRLTRDTLVFQKHALGQLKQKKLTPSQRKKYINHCFITKKHGFPAHVGLVKPKGNKDAWIVASDEPVTAKTFKVYALRFDIEENFLDDKSNGFQLESSRLRHLSALKRLFFVLSVATVCLVLMGTAVSQQGLRHQFDPHFKRGLSYLKIGWRYFRYFLLHQNEKMILPFFLSSQPDPEPVKAHSVKTKGEITYCF